MDSCGYAWQPTRTVTGTDSSDSFWHSWTASSVSPQLSASPREKAKSSAAGRTRARVTYKTNPNKLHSTQTRDACYRCRSRHRTSKKKKVRAHPLSALQMCLGQPLLHLERQNDTVRYERVAKRQLPSFNGGETDTSQATPAAPPESVGPEEA